MRSRFLCLLLMLFLLPGAALAAGDKALMLTVFGTSAEEAVIFNELALLLQERFPDREIVVPYTSGTIRQRMNAQIADPADYILSPAEMLEKLKKNGCSDIAVVTTMLFAGTENDKLQSEVAYFAANNIGIKVKYVPPVLSKRKRLQAVVNILGKYMISDGANIVVTHGSEGGEKAEENYTLAAELIVQTYPNARVASIEGIPERQAAFEWLEKQPGENVRFIPLMFAPGGHIRKDIASDDGDSFFSAARSAGKNPSLPWLDQEKRRVASMGLDPEYRRILLDYYARHLEADADSRSCRLKEGCHTAN